MDFLPYIISGLVTGSVYGLAGTGLVLTYKTSAIFNFAHGALATLGAFVFYTLYVDHGLPWPIAVALCVVVVGPLLGAVFEVLARLLMRTSVAARVAATVGVLLGIQAAIELIYGTTNEKTFPHFLPQQSFHLHGTPITVEQIIDVAAALLATIGLSIYFRRTRTGVAMRAVVDDADLLSTAGTNPQRVRRWAWVIGCAFAVASGLFIAPLLIPLNATTITLLVITSFAAAAVGGFTNLPLTYCGGIAIGLLQALCTKYFANGFWTGIAPSLPFLVLFFVLLASPSRRLAERSILVPPGRSHWRAPGTIQTGGGIVGLALLALVPNLVGYHLLDWTVALTTVVLFLSLGLLVRTSGQVSLCHVSFLAIGACAMAQFAGMHHIPWLPALILSGLVAIPVGAVLAIPAIRFSGPYLALATFGFGLLLQNMFYSEHYMFGEFGLPVTVQRPHLAWLTLDSDRGYYYLLLAFVLVTTLLVAAITRSRLGRLLRGLAESPTGLASTGVSINTTRVLVFCLSAFLAAVAGALLVGVQPVSSDGFQPITSLTYLVVVVISVGGEPWYALFGGLTLTLIPVYVSGASAGRWLQLSFGVGAVAYALTPESLRGVPSPARAWLERLRWRRTARSVANLPAQLPRPKVSAGSLALEGVRVTFGGLVAVNNVSLEAPTGRITGLIGPNGAGKTTTFNACSGLINPSRGRITVDGVSVARRSPCARARAGIGRTFQQMELFDTLTVRANVALGREGGYASANPLRHLVGSRSQAKHVAEWTDEALRLCDLQSLTDTPAGDLSTGQRRLVELARCLAGSFRFLLLDEPSSGLDVSESMRLGSILRRVVEERGVGILLVEHDMSLVTEVCDYIYMLDFGSLIFEGTPASVMASPLVKAAYLGVADEAMVETDNATGVGR